MQKKKFYLGLILMLLVTPRTTIALDSQVIDWALVTACSHFAGAALYKLNIDVVGSSSKVATVIGHAVGLSATIIGISEILKKYHAGNLRYSIPLSIINYALVHTGLKLLRIKQYF